MALPRVTDHAVLRYIQRKHGIDVEWLRKHIADLCRHGTEQGALAVRVEGVKFMLQGNVVTTVNPDEGHPDKHTKARVAAWDAGGTS